MLVVFAECMSMVVFSIMRRFDFVKSSKTFADGLREEVRHLENEAERVAILAVVARNNLRNFNDLFSEWEASAEKALKEARDLLDDFERASMTCCRGFLADPHIRYRFNKRAKGKIEEIRQLAHKCSGFKELNDISFGDPAPGCVAALIPARREGKDVVQSITVTASASSALASTKLKDRVFKSRAVMIRKIMHALADNSNIVVGVYGMGGVGKSTLLVDVNKEIRQKKLFDWVAKADVSENPDIKRIQGEIAHCLGLSDIKNEENVNMRAELLCRRLKYEAKENKKVLIILDNLWERLDLKSVGIPCGLDNKVIGCKLLLTSRDRNVLQREMGCDRDFYLNVLEEDEAKKLFERMVGDRVHDDEFKPLVDEALHKCAGLPFLIVSMAKHCKDASVSEWKDALRRIERPEDKGIDEVMNNMLQLSFDHLEVKEAKSLLQQCVVNGVSRPSIRDLAMYGMHLGLLQENDSMEEPIERFRLLILALQTSFLLLKNGDGDDFKVHDLVREFVASVALRDRPRLLLKDKGKSVTALPKDKLKSCRAEELERCSSDSESSPIGCSRKVLMCGGLGLTEPPEAMQWQSFTEIYLMENQLAELPENTWCPGLLVLFLNRNCKLRTISQNFFDFMPALEILNLSRTRIKSLPESLFRLSGLKRLFLNHCELLMVLPPQIGELKQLEVLDLEGTEIMDLPKEVAKLTKLTCLEVSFCPLTNCGTNCAEANALIPQGTISILSQLEELSIDVHPEDERWESVVEAIVDDVCGLLRLDTLRLYFPQIEHLRKFKWIGTPEVYRSLSHFKFVVGKHAERIICYLPEDLEFELEHWDRSLKYVNGVGVPIDIQKMLQHTTAFFLDRHGDVAKLSDFGIENMEQLKCCIIGECDEIKFIVGKTDANDEAYRSETVLETQEDGRRFLGSLEYLYIYHMKSLSCICEGRLPRGSFSCLKCLALFACPQLTSIFTSDLLKNLDSLEELNVEDCPLVFSLVTCEDTSSYESTYFLPKLKNISLVLLPELITISNGLHIAPNLERLSIIDCPNLQSPSADDMLQSSDRGYSTKYSK